MDVLIGIWLIIVGLVGIFYPSFFFKSELLTPQKIQRNKRIWRWFGISLVLGGIAVLVFVFFR